MHIWSKNWLFGFGAGNYIELLYKYSYGKNNDIIVHKLWAFAPGNFCTAGKEAAELEAAFLALPHSTVEDEAKPEWQAAEQAWLKAGRDFADTPATSIAGMFVKLRALVDDIIEDVPPAETDPSWEYRHAKTILAFLEGFTGAAQAEPLVELWAEQNRLVALCCAADIDTEIDQRGDELSAIEHRIANTEARTLAGVVVQIKLRESVLGHDHWVLSAALTRNVVTALERMGGAP